jgi:hypothetical protein
MPGPSHHDDDMATPMIIHESQTHVIVAIEIPKAALQRHRRFIEALSAVIARLTDG